MRCLRWTAKALLLAGCLSAGPRLAAQSAADRAALTALQDTLNTLSDPGTLAAIQPKWSGRRAPGMERLRQGFIALRRGQITGRVPDLQDALLRFDDAVHDAWDWPYPWYGRGLTKLALGELRTVPAKAVAGQQAGELYYDAFVRDEVAALERDSVFAPVLGFLAAALDAQRDRGQPRAFIRALERGGRAGPIDRRAHLVVARAQRLAGDNPAALDQLDAYLHSGGDSGVAALERARILAGSGRLDQAAAAYRSGAAHPDSLARDLYRDDLAWIATPEELAAFDSLRADSVSAWLTQFWTLRAAESLRGLDERIGEHLRRWSYANRNFRVVHPERRTQFAQVRVLNIGPCSPGGEKALDYYHLPRPDRPDDYRRSERVLDDRAPVYMRHGEPMRRINTLGSSIAAADEARSNATSGSALLPDDPGDDAGLYTPEILGEAGRQAGLLGGAVWLYWIAGKPRVFYFAGSDALGHYGPTTLYTEPVLSPYLFDRLAELDPAYGKAASILRSYEMLGGSPMHRTALRCQRSIDDVYRLAKADVGVATHTDSYTLTFARQLSPVVQTFALGQPARGTSRVLVSVAVPGERLQPDADGGAAGVRYTLRLRISAVDSLRGIVRQLDTTRRFAAADTLHAGQFLTQLFEVPLPAGSYTARVAVQSGADAGGATLRPGTVLSDSVPRLSDIVLGTTSGGLRWENGGDPVHLNVLGAYPRGGVAELYYETYGLEPGRAYRTLVNVRRVNSKPGDGVSLSFEETATASAQHVRRSVDLGKLARGQYDLSVTLRDLVTGRQAVVDQYINIVER